MGEESRVEPDEEEPLLPGMYQTEIHMNALKCDVHEAIQLAVHETQQGDMHGLVDLVAADLWRRGWTLDWIKDEED